MEENTMKTGSIYQKQSETRADHITRRWIPQHLHNQMRTMVPLDINLDIPSWNQLSMKHVYTVIYVDYVQNKNVNDKNELKVMRCKVSEYIDFKRLKVEAWKMV